MMNLKKFKDFFDERFLAVIEEKGRLFASYSEHNAVPEIIFHIRTIAESGKRFRPYLAYCGYVTEGGEEDIFPLLAAIELVHLFCLIHDDVIDQADTRRGVATINKKFGNAIGVLAGDIVLSWAHECLQDLEAIEPYTVDDVKEEIAVLLAEVIHGQILDVLTDKADTREEIEKIMELKSARYSFYHPLYCGMLLAGSDDETQDFVEEYGTNIGKAFQVLDDIADYAIDSRTKKQTLLQWYVDGNPDKKLSDAFVFSEEIGDEYIAAASDAIFSYNKNNEPVWEEIIEEVQRAFRRSQ